MLGTKSGRLTYSFSVRFRTDVARDRTAGLSGPAALGSVSPTESVVCDTIVFGTQDALATAMDIVRDESFKKKKRQKQVILSVVGIIAAMLLFLAVYRLPKAVPSVDYGTIWPDTV